MSESEEVRHTPGPWYWDDDESALYSRCDDREGAVLCGISTGTPSCYSADVSCDDADARLIAAAPDLLAACEKAEAILRDCLAECDSEGVPADPGQLELLSILQAAIAKARGVTQEGE